MVFVVLVHEDGIFLSYDVVYFSKCVMWAASDEGKLSVLKLLLQHLTELISYWRLLLEGLYKEI